MANRTKAETTTDSRTRLCYGISLEEVAEMRKKQGNKCAICEREFGTDKANSPHIDHEHSSGWVRGLLCTTCNTGLGCFKDDIQKLQRAVEYVISNAVPTEFDIYAARQSQRRKFPRFSPEERERRKSFMTGNTWRNGLTPWNKGKEWGEATRQKMSESAKRRWSAGQVE